MIGSTFFKVFLKSGWVVLTVGCIFLFSITLSYFSFRSDWNFLKVKQDVVFNAFWRTAFYIHITGGMVAIVSGPIQFLASFRNRYRLTHRAIGKVYVGVILFMAGPSGLFMAFYAEGGTVGAAGFLTMALLWFGTTYLALEQIRKGNVARHRDWMTRSFALSLAAVTLRTWVPLASRHLGIDQELVIQSSAWISWVPNLLVAELLIRFAPKKL
jgi:uncharacterized membrane protein